MSFSPPNYTQTPNELYSLQKDMKEAELRVTLVIVRATFGWNLGGHAAALTLQELMNETGMSKQGVLNGIEAGRERGTVRTVKLGKEVYYGLSVEGVELPEKGQLSRPKTVNLVDPEGQRSRPIAKSKGQLSRPQQSTKLTATVNEVDPEGQRSRPSTPAFLASGRQKTAPKDSERQERQERQIDVVGPAEDDFSAEHPNAGGSLEEPSRHPQVGAAAPATGDAPDDDRSGTAMAALVAAFAPWKVQKLIEEIPTRQGPGGWLGLDAATIRDLHARLRGQFGSRYRGDLAGELDQLVYEQQNQPTEAAAAPTSDDDVDMAALMRAAPLNGVRRKP